MLQIGMIGSGVMASVHSESLLKSGLAKVTRVCSVAPNADDFASRFGAKLVKSADQIFEDPSIDVVFIASPSNTHAEYLRKAHAANKHIFCEKPLVRTEAEADEIEKLFEGYAKKVTVGHVVRFIPEYAHLHEISKAGTLGNIGTIRTGRCGAFPVGTADWFSRFEQSGGVILDLLIHDIDTVRWCFGDFERIYAMRPRVDGKDLHHDYALTLARLKSGAIVHMEGSWAEAQGLFYTYYEVAGTQGMVEYDSRLEPTLTVQQKKVDKSEQEGAILPKNPAKVSPYELEVRSFLDALVHDKQPEVSLSDGLQAVRIALAGLRSATQDEPVNL